MLDFSDKPYQFFPAKPNRFVIGLVKQLNRRFVLPGPRHRIKRIELRGADRVLLLLQGRKRCLFLPNHSTHSDPQLMMEVQRRLRTTSHTMAAYDVFLRGRLQAWVMQRIGCFSVDRDGSDSQAMKCAVEVLTKGQRPLTIFPEGNVHLMNGRVSPFLDGAAFIALRAQKKLGVEAPIYALPVALHFSFLQDCRDRLLAEIADLEKQLQIDTKAELSLRSRLRKIGVMILNRNLKQRGYTASNEHDDLETLLHSSVTQIITKLEEKIEVSVSDDVVPLERVRRIRTAIHQVRIDEKRQLDHRVAATWADEAILAVRILSYASDYLAENPTLDRHSETLEKLKEDLWDRIFPPLGDRAVVVQFGDPIDMTQFLDVKSSRQALAQATARFESGVRQGLEEICATNDLPGNQLLE